MADLIREENLKISLLDVDDFIKKNDFPEVTNPVTFDANKNPTNDGLLSNILFGITKESRANTFAYIDLKRKFIRLVTILQLRLMNRRLILLTLAQFAP